MLISNSWLRKIKLICWKTGSLSWFRYLWFLSSLFLAWIFFWLCSFDRWRRWMFFIINFLFWSFWGNVMDNLHWWFLFSWLSVLAPLIFLEIKSIDLLFKLLKFLSITYLISVGFILILFPLRIRQILPSVAYLLHDFKNMHVRIGILNFLTSFSDKNHVGTQTFLWSFWLDFIELVWISAVVKKILHFSIVSLLVSISKFFVDGSFLFR